ncbi:RNA-binding S4 domain-containing protein [Neorhizobium galegae]|uniref:RNA-binding S4 domain-containing protein n=1 Tax=Neorhizobium galegae TaxID=399 RepID=UPI0006215B0F|nr:RNA-binding S4 domain-containing protein [Neorhizobium galegae]CDZ27228.1 RNA-binding S4 domain-containing protein [Neorhizobium galegae bv. officinalis]KAA9385070.1 RNA-binding S4 domain-containing protein [Neorhizobium galegae]KAB1110591.1 RNA-binding S4 domain-containing protein [Neorhizobium galegae]MCM2497806.1 RNA-binding S4 domain-containing protein [Neorhizobium galegae]MCQ1768915.1 RNA-binding S4 domain-containing protein [Neorhizobium galegae]
MTEKQPQSGSRQRIDKWLFFARMAKSRSIAQDMIRSNHVRVNGDLVSQPSSQVKPGDRIDLKLERRDLVLVVKTGGERRGPFEEARLLYEDLSPPPEETKRLTLFEQAQRAQGSGRPTKKERRETDRLFPGIDADLD